MSADNADNDVGEVAGRCALTSVAHWALEARSERQDRQPVKSLAQRAGRVVDLSRDEVEHHGRPTLRILGRPAR